MKARRVRYSSDPSHDARYSARSADFQKMPGEPIAYWVSDAVRDVYRVAVELESIAPVRQGMATGNNDRFTRLWFEVSRHTLGLAMESKEDAFKSGKIWFPYNKGGPYRKWYGNNETVIRFDESAYEILKTQGNNCPSEEFYFRPSATWTFVSSAAFGVRQCPSGFVFDVGGSSCFPTIHTELVTGFLCSRISSIYLRATNPTLNYQAGNVRALPWLKEQLQPLQDSISENVSELISTAKADWDSFETSWDYTCNVVVEQMSIGTLAEAREKARGAQREVIVDTNNREVKNNTTFLECYGLSDEASPVVNSGEITLSCNPSYRYDEDKSEPELEALLLADTMREFISYAVGCMLGRYSLDKPGLILANAGDTADDYRQQIPEPTFAPDEDNVIPLLDGDWFTDDISERFKEFLKVTFGTEHYEENLTFLEDALYPKNLTGSKRKDIRDYFLKDFYNHHIKLYKKRPIYWLFSSPKGTFNALIYMHRYREDTVSVILNDYLREFQTKLTAKLDHLQSVADSGEASKIEKTKALKEITKLKKQLKELVDYERDILYPLASEQIEIDLDDGVKVNYNKFGKALKKVTGLTGK